MVIDDTFSLKEFDKMTLEEKMALPEDVMSEIVGKQRAEAKKKDILGD